MGDDRLLKADEAGLGYVPAIDGLRAVAIAAVVAYHLGPGRLPGGFAGVDLFFVISGFVVTASLMRRPAESFGALAGGFFARRVARIVPALVAMLLVTALASVLLIPLAAEKTLVRGTAVAAAAGAANVFLAIWDDPYAVRNAGLNPLLHTWTLGVEEQFYLVFPFLFHLRRGRPGRTVAAVAVASALSILICVLLPRGSATLNFYMMPTRFWELGAGALLCLTFDRWKGLKVPGWAATAGAVLCGAVLLLCFYRPTGAFPMPGALPVVAASLGLIALICLHPAGLAARMLSIPPALYIGRISFALYLWHWPVIVLLDWTIGLQGWANALAALALSFAFAMASYHLIEQPFRRAAKASPLGRWRIVAIGVAALALCAVVTTLLFRAEPALTLSRHDQPVDILGVSSAPCAPVSAVVRVAGGWIFSWAPRCAASRGSGKLVVIGDSHANRWRAVIPRYVAETRVAASVVTHGNCDFPALSAPMALKPGCRAFYAAAIGYALRTLKPGDVLFLSSLRYPAAATDEKSFAANIASPPPGTEAEYVALTRRLAATGARVIIEAPEPIFSSPAFRCMDWFNRYHPVCRAGLTVDRHWLETMRGPMLARMRRLAEAVPGVEIWDPLAILCPGAECSALRDGRPIYTDNDHLNGRGHVLLYPGLRAVLRLGGPMQKGDRQ
ncbi:MAG: acyltransferase family protein [Sphingomonas sp.]|jgi:peptidoglycan/LPS O-acetylase OafA/YrhL|uniref:acyltransferase family protein n=1 Tax=Sphingomonas sp. TaxID=28214 RepID=UPI003561671B